jgi:hypothetical protein
VHTSGHLVIRHVNNGSIVDMSETTMPALEIGDSRGEIGMLGERRSDVESV